MRDCLFLQASIDAVLRFLGCPPIKSYPSYLLKETNSAQAIEALQGPTKHRGRPPKNPLAAAPSTAASALKKHRRRFSAAQRKAASERMRLRWAAKRKAAAKATAKPKAKKRTKAA